MQPPAMPHAGGILDRRQEGAGRAEHWLAQPAGCRDGADFHFGSGEVLRVRSRSQTAAMQQGYPATAFDVPLRTMERLAYSPRTWVRVYTEGGNVDETINSGEETSRAFTAMNYFMGGVESYRSGPQRRCEHGRADGPSGPG
jgi:hypothetical protein